MKKLYRNILMASAIGAFTAGCGGEGQYDPTLNPEDLADNDKAPILIQDVAYLFGGIFKQLVGALDISSSTTSMTNDSTTMGAIISDAINQAQSSVASGISLVTDADCSKLGKLELGAHFELGTGGTPDTEDIIGSFSNNVIETSIKMNFLACEEYGRKPGAPDAMAPADDRLDKSTETLLDGVMNVSFTSFPNAAKDGFSLDANITLDDFEMVEVGGDFADKGSIRFDGEFDVSLKSTDTTNADSIQFLTNIGAAYVNSRANEYEHIKIDASGQLTTDSGFGKYSYNLDFKGATSNYAVSNKTFEYFTTSNLTKATLSSGFVPEGGELMIITPEGDAGTATVKVAPNNGPVTVEINFDGQTTSCTFGELIAGSDKCGKPTN